MNDSPKKSQHAFTADDPVMRVVRKTRNAQRDASHCAGCEREIKPGEPVWRSRVSWHCLFGWIRKTQAI